MAFRKTYKCFPSLALRFCRTNQQRRDQLWCVVRNRTGMTSSESQWVYGRPETQIPCHSDTFSRRPAMFIPTTLELLRGVKIACEFFRDRCHDVRISIIDVRAAKRSYHDMTNAMAIASLLGLSNPQFYCRDCLFLRRIKSLAIVYLICMDQGMYDRITWIIPSLDSRAVLQL